MPCNLQEESVGGVLFLLFTNFNDDDCIFSHGTIKLFLSNFLDKNKGDLLLKWLDILI